MTLETRRLAGMLLIVVPTVAFGGVSLLRLLIDDPAYADNPLRQDLWRAGHAHAGVLLVLSLVALSYVDQARLAGPARAVARFGVPVAAILLPAAMFLSVLDADATSPNPLIHLAWPGALSLAAGVVTLGVGLIRAGAPGAGPTTTDPGAGADAGRRVSGTAR
jgi:hypothetical protein